MKTISRLVVMSLGIAGLLFGQATNVDNPINPLSDLPSQINTRIVAQINTWATGLVFAANTTATTNNFFTAYNSTTGAFTKARPTCANISDAGTACTATIASYATLASPTFTGTPAAPTAAADTNTTQVATTAFVVGQAGSATPNMDGTGAVGTSLKYARSDHTHASDTSRAPLASPTLTGTPAAPTAAADTSTTQLATTAFVVGQASSATPIVEGSGTVGTSLKYARADHVHPSRTMTLPYGCAVGDPAGSALATGVLCYVVVPMAGTITGWDIVVDGGTATVDVLKIATGTAKPTASIAASALPAISTGTAIHSTTLTSWTTSVAANDILGFNYTTGTVPKYITVNVQVAH